MDSSSEPNREPIISWREEERSCPERCLTWEATHTWRGFYQTLKVWSVLLFSLMVFTVADHDKQLPVAAGEGVVPADVLPRCSRVEHLMTCVSLFVHDEVHDKIIGILADPVFFLFFFERLQSFSDWYQTHATYPNKRSSGRRNAGETRGWSPANVSSLPANICLTPHVTFATLPPLCSLIQFAAAINSLCLASALPLHCFFLPRVFLFRLLSGWSSAAALWPVWKEQADRRVADGISLSL